MVYNDQTHSVWYPRDGIECRKPPGTRLRVAAEAGSRPEQRELRGVVTDSVPTHHLHRKIIQFPKLTDVFAQRAVSQSFFNSEPLTVSF